MEAIKHIAIYTSAEENTEELASLIMKGKAFYFAEGLEKKNGALFSAASIRQLVKEELLHDHFEVKPLNGHSLATSSSGEQRRALLDSLLSKKTDYIIIDNIFESIDKAGQHSIITKLRALAAHTMIIQICYRKHDCLPFIERVITLEKGLPVKEEKRADFLSSELELPVFNGNIPAPYEASATGSEVLVEMKNITVSFEGRKVLNNISWSIKQGEFWQLSGANGSGKSTLLSMIIGDSPKGYGQELYLFGQKKGTGETVWDIKQKTGYFTSSVAQEFPRMDSAERIIIGGFFDSIGLYIHPADAQVKLAEEWLRLLGLYDQRHQPFRFFTMAQQRMILVARAMVKHPPLLILDEPASGLDDKNALLFVSLVNKIAAETTTAIIYVSHRDEMGLKPGKTFELVPSDAGSAGVVARP